MSAAAEQMGPEQTTMSMAPAAREPAPQHSCVLDAALLNAQRSITGIAPDARNNNKRYDYVSAEGMVRESRNALHATGLLFGLSDCHTYLAEKPPRLRLTFRLSHPSSGESRTWSTDQIVLEHKGMPLDKAAKAAETTGISYCLRGLLLIPRSLGPELDTSRQQGGRQDGNGGRQGGHSGGRQGNHGTTVEEARGQLRQVYLSKLRTARGHLGATAWSAVLTEVNVAEDQIGQLDEITLGALVHASRQAAITMKKAAQVEQVEQAKAAQAKAAETAPKADAAQQTQTQAQRTTTTAESHTTAETASCSSCGGSGRWGNGVCGVCKGEGKVVIQPKVKCSSCDGRGWSRGGDGKCTWCDGKGYTGGANGRQRAST